VAHESPFWLLGMDSLIFPDTVGLSFRKSRQPTESTTKCTCSNGCMRRDRSISLQISQLPRILGTSESRACSAQDSLHPSESRKDRRYGILGQEVGERRPRKTRPTSGSQGGMEVRKAGQNAGEHPSPKTHSAANSARKVLKNNSGPRGTSQPQAHSGSGLA